MGSTEIKDLAATTLHAITPVKVQFEDTGLHTSFGQYIWNVLHVGGRKTDLKKWCCGNLCKRESIQWPY